MKTTVILSLILSILHSILFWGKDIGISIFLFTIAILYILCYILNKNDIIKNKKALIINIPILIISATYFIFNNSFFKVMNMIAIIILFAIMLILAIKKEKTINWLSKIFNIFFGPLELIKEATSTIIEELIPNNQNQKKTNSNNTLKQIIKGVLISLPILLIVLLLLSSADFIFAEAFKNWGIYFLKSIKITNIITAIIRLLLIIALYIYFVAFVINIKKPTSDFNDDENEQDIENWKNKIQIEGITINTILTLLNIVYLIFTVTQGIFLISQIQTTTLSNYADYARKGFFQLMIVSFINFAIIFISNNNKTELSKANKNYNKVMNILMLLFTIIILISSVLRMNLYEKEYGYTFLRLMVYFIQITELIAIVPTIVYILNKKIKIFKLYLLIITTMYIILNFANIDKIIAQSNISRYIEKNETKEIDFNYLQNHTSTDAIPEIIQLFKTTKNEKLKIQINNYLLKEYEELNNQRSWQEYNISKNKAQKLLEELELELKPTQSTQKNIRENQI